uniref:Putative secreted protein n=1 Tax=Anopheles marajoara TaxID=58244 RepID=A0A2M4CFP2_9DIPT
MMLPIVRLFVSRCRRVTLAIGTHKKFVRYFWYLFRVDLRHRGHRVQFIFKLTILDRCSFASLRSAG